MWPISTTPAAQVLGVSPANLRRWVRQGKFSHIEGMTRERRPGSFQEQRLFTRAWVEAVAKELNVEPDFSGVEQEQR
jgi:predicted site-specific integrase-resolvase